jgi:subtilase family serine protease
VNSQIASAAIKKRLSATNMLEARANGVQVGLVDDATYAVSHSGLLGGESIEVAFMNFTIATLA